MHQTVSEGLNILLVEDDDIDSRMIGERLYSTGFKLVYATTCKQAHEIIKQHSFDVALIDMQLPDGHGTQIISHLKDVQPETALIVVTGDENENKAITTLQLGAQDYLYKSRISSEEELLHRAVRYALERKRLENELISARCDAEQARKESEKSNAAKSNFLANLSHEIRTPLTSIIGFAELLPSVDHSKKDKSDCINTIIKNAKYLKNLIHDILDLSSIEAGKVEVELKEFSLSDELAQIFMLLNKRAEDNHLRLYFDFIGPIPEKIYSDPVRLRQILMNIVGNAIKFTHEGSVTVKIFLEEMEGVKYYDLVFDITDSGIGIAGDRRDLLFKPFSQIDNGTRKRHGGSGLGLILSRHISTALGGSLKMIWSELGKGSTFELRVNPGYLHPNSLRYDFNQSDFLAKSAGQNFKFRGNLLKNRSILLVEDTEDIRTLNKTLLEAEGADVDIARNGKEAIEIVGSNGGFDIILMDLHMPIMDGYEATQALRSNGYEAPIIAVTARALKQEVEKVIEIGCDDCITKPFNLENFYQIVHRHIRASDL